MVLLLTITHASAQPAQWGYVAPMIQKLDVQLENFAANQFQSPIKVLIARSSIRTRVLARDLLASGAADPSDVGMAMVFYGTMIYEHLDALDNLYNQLPDIAAMERDLVTPTENQRRTYLLLKPALERFSQNPIGKLRLNVLYPGQVRNRVSQAFAPLADALDAANLPLIRNTWQPSTQSIIQPDQFDVLLARFDALTIDTSHLPVKDILSRVKPALQIQEYRPLVNETYGMMALVVQVLEILQKQPTAFMQARPLMIQQIEAGLANYQKPESRNIGLGQLEFVLSFTDVMIRLDQLQTQLQDTLAYEQLLAKVILQNDRAMIAPMYHWLSTILDNWYHIRRFNRPTDSAYVPSHEMLTSRWDQIQTELKKLTETMAKNLPIALTSQHEQWLAECRTTRGMFDDLAQLPILITHRSHGPFVPLKQVAGNILNLTGARAGSTIQQANAYLLALSKQWAMADKLNTFKPYGVLDTHLPEIQARIDRDIKQWVTYWQSADLDPTHAGLILKPSVDLMKTTEMLNLVQQSASDRLFSRMGIIDLNRDTCEALLALTPAHTKELARLYADAGNPQDMQLNLERARDDLSFMLAIGRLVERFGSYTPADLNAPASHVLSRLIWQPVSDEYDPELTQLCVQLCLTAREWSFQKQQDDPRHRRELLKQLRDLGNKINTRLDELK